MAYRTLDITLISAQNLKNVNHLSKLQVYAVASLAGDPRTRQRTPTDRNGGQDPTWEFPLRFTVPTDADMAGRLAIHVVLRAERVFGDRDIGESHIPLKDIVSSNCTSTTQGAQFASYQVHKPNSRKPRGILNISYKLGEQIAAPQVPIQEPVTAYPAPQQYGAPPSYGYNQPYGYPQRGYPYGYPPQQPMQQGVRNRNNMGMGLGAGLLGGALGGLLVGDMISDMGAYDSGYDAGFDDAGFGDAGGFDGGFDGGF